MSLEAYHGSLWLCEPLRLQQLAARVRAYRPCPTAREVVEARRAELAEARQAAARAVRAVKGKVGVIPVYGPVDQRMNADLMKAGGTSTEAVGAALDALLNDAQVEAVVLDVDSPGGSVYGTPELSDKIYNARGRKPIYAVANSMAASAGYWIASAAGDVAVTPAGDVGSVGVYAVHVDRSKEAEAEGIAVTFVHAGKYKVEGHPYAPLGEEARAHFQERVDETYGKFLQALSRNRGVSPADVRRDFGQGRLVGAGEAREARMVDRVMTFEELLGRLTGSTSAGHQASAEVLRARHEMAKRRTGAL